jgi:putative flippase GtrA
MVSFIKKILDLFYPLVSRILDKTTYYYAACGGGNMAFDIFLYFIFHNFVFDKQDFHIGCIVMQSHIAAFIAVFPITQTSGFLLQKYITFNSSRLRSRIQFFRYLLVSGVNILITYAILKLLVDYIGLYPTPSKIITVVITAVISYLLQKKFTFK